MEIVMLPAALVLIAVVVLVAKSIVVVPKGMAYTVAKLGRMDAVLHEGLHIVPPFVCAVTARVPTTEQAVDVVSANGRLRDGTAAAVRGTLRYRVSDPMKALTAVADYRQAVTVLATTQWLEALEQSDLTGWHESLGRAAAPMREAASAWGVEILEAAARIDLPAESLNALESQAARERQLRVLQWLRERGESPGPDGVPTDAQNRAFASWMEHAVNEHRHEIDAAKADAEGSRFSPAGLEIAVARSTLVAGGDGRVEMNGREYHARNTSRAGIQAGFRCVAEGRDGDTLLVRPV